MPRCYMVKKSAQRQSPRSPTEGSVAPSCYSPDEDSALTVSEDQVVALLDYMEDNKDLACGKLTGADASTKAEQMWNGLCDYLNRLEGRVMSIEQWQAVWAFLAEKAAKVEEKLERGESLEFDQVEQRVLTIFGVCLPVPEAEESSDPPEDVQANSATPTVATPATPACPCRLLQSSVIICPLSQQQPPVWTDAPEAPEQQPEQQNQSTSHDARGRRLVRRPFLSDQAFKREMLNIFRQMRTDKRKLYRRMLSLM